MTWVKWDGTGDIPAAERVEIAGLFGRAMERANAATSERIAAVFGKVAAAGQPRLLRTDEIDYEGCDSCGGCLIDQGKLPPCESAEQHCTHFVEGDGPCCRCGIPLPVCSCVPDNKRLLPPTTVRLVLPPAEVEAAGRWFAWRQRMQRRHATTGIGGQIMELQASPDWDPPTNLELAFDARPDGLATVDGGCRACKVEAVTGGTSDRHTHSTQAVLRDWAPRFLALPGASGPTLIVDGTEAIDPRVPCGKCGGHGYLPPTGSPGVTPEADMERECDCDDGKVFPWAGVIISPQADRPCPDCTDGVEVHPRCTHGPWECERCHGGVVPGTPPDPEVVAALRAQAESADVEFVEVKGEYPAVRTVLLSICDACLDGTGEMCDTPGCALIRHLVDIPIDKDLVTFVPWSTAQIVCAGVEVLEAARRKVEEMVEP